MPACPTLYALAWGGLGEIWARLVINLNFNTINRRLTIDHFGPHHVSTVDNERMSEIKQAFEAVRGGQLHWFLAWFLKIYRILTCLELGRERHSQTEEIQRSSGGFRSRRSGKLHALSFSFVFGMAWVQNCRINRPKTPKNHLRQHWKTKGSELYLSDCP